MADIRMTDAQLKALLKAVRDGEEIEILSPSEQMSAWIRSQLGRSTLETEGMTGDKMNETIRAAAGRARK